MAEDPMPAWAGALQTILIERIVASEAGVLARLDQRIEASETTILGHLDQRIEASEAAILARIDRDVRRPLIEHIDTRTAAIMERIDRLQARVDSHADDLQVNLAAARRAEIKAAEVEDALLQRELARTQDMRAMSEVINAMQRQIGRLQAEVRDLRERG